MDDLFPAKKERKKAAEEGLVLQPQVAEMKQKLWDIGWGLMRDLSKRKQPAA